MEKGDTTFNMSDSEEELTFHYGTPLEPYEEDDIPSKRRAQQSHDYALDVHGRRRFHGAFTGASQPVMATRWTPWKDGLLPLSRALGANASAAPEDFMDEEDQDEFGIAPRHIRTQSDFATEKRSQKRYHDGTIPGAPVLENFVRAVPDTAAVRLLRRMGWRPGRRIGEKMKPVKKYGCYVPPEFRQNQEDSDEDSDLDAESLFESEPEQTKNDRFGIGYAPLSRHRVLGGTAGEYGGSGGVSHLKMNEGGKKVSIRGQAFGVGALENEDEDIYGVTDMSHYDFSLGGPSKVETKKKQKSEGLEGFIRARKPQPAPPAYPPPALPRDYVPVAAGFARTRFDEAAAGDSHIKLGLGRHDLSIEQRGALINETTKTNNVSQARNNIEKDNPIGKGKDCVTNTRDSITSENTFQPFASDPEKQSRYDKFLKGDYDENEAIEEMGGWEAVRERAEFEQAKKLYKPLTGVLKDRFTSGSGQDTATESRLSDDVAAARRGMYGALTRTRVEWRPDGLLCKRFNVPDIYAERPDKKMDKSKTTYSIFDSLEGSIHSKESFTEEQTHFGGSKSLRLPQTNEKNVPAETASQQTTTLQAVVPPPKLVGNKRMTVAELFLMEAEKDREKAKNESSEIVNTIDKFDKMELYKSIFMSDSEDEPENTDTIEFNGKKANNERNDSPPRGIFANIDFDKLNTRPSTSNVTKETSVDNIQNKTETNKNDSLFGIEDELPPIKIIANKEIVTNRDIDIEELLVDKPTVDERDLYGPKIPENLKKKIESNAMGMDLNSIGNTYINTSAYRETDIEEILSKDNTKSEERILYRDKKTREAIIIESSSESDAWVDANETKKKKDKKKKNKKHKHKSKHKKKY